MKKLLLLSALTVALPCALAAGEIRDISQTFKIEGQSAIRLDIPVAELEVEGGGSGTVEMEFIATCKHDHDCDSILKKLEFQKHASRNTLRIDLMGYPKWGKGRVEIEGVVRLPKEIEVEIELGVGEIELKELTGDLRVELGVGEVNAWLDKKTTHAVTLDAGVGEVELYGAGKRMEGRRSMLVGSEAYWDEGPGEARVFLEVGVGEISVWVE